MNARYGKHRSQIEKYPAGWRLLHWVMALMVILLIPVGLWMTARGEADLWDSLTNTLYSWHKAIGFTVLILMVVRIGLKVFVKSPPYPDHMPRSLQLAAKGVHYLMYALLVLTPLFGWAGVTAFPALVTVGGHDLPAMPFVPVDRELAGTLFDIHGLLAMGLALLLIGHIAAAVRHMLLGDGIFQRML